MSKLTIYKERGLDATMIPNSFIDDYAAGANDIQLKVYLYMIRMTGAGLPFSVSDMADKFNHSEKDIMRALRYWEKARLISLDYDSDQNLKALHILPITEGGAAAVDAQRGEIVTLGPKLVSPSNEQVSKRAAEEERTEAQPGKRAYSADELNAFGSDPDTSQVVFIAEQYIGRTLSRSDIETLIFIHDELGFSVDLIDFLIQYCVDKGKKKFSYIEKVAINWAEDNIFTVRQAKNRMTRYDKQVFAIMKALGKDGNNPTEVEMNYIRSWLKELNYNLEIITVACERTVLATDRNRFQYANAILKSWHEKGVKHLKDIEVLDAAHEKSAVKKKPVEKKNAFNDFSGQRNYNYEDLEKLLVSN